MRQVLRRDNIEVERLDDKKEARADDGRRFQKEGPSTEKDLDLSIVVLVRGRHTTKRCLGLVMILREVIAPLSCHLRKGSNPYNPRSIPTPLTNRLLRPVNL